MNIVGKNIVVTGGASGLGLAFVKQLQDLGAHVWVLDRNCVALQAVAQNFDKATSHPRFLLCDVGIEEQVVQTVKAIEQETDGIDILINNAAVLKDQALISKLRGNIKKHSLSDWQETLTSNLTGIFLMTREVAEGMIRRNRRGLIVNISSISRKGNAGQSAYAASKAGIDALTVTWSQELATYGIRVVGIAPGFVETSMTQRIPTLFLEQIRHKSPLKRFGTLEEFGQTIQYVIENDYFHGKILELDGGMRF
jgi:3-oxoacyl-[acyl-carrier protein] reductase